jgi:hypothetical protein
VFLALDQKDEILERNSMLYLLGDLEAHEFGYFLGSYTFFGQGLQQNFIGLGPNQICTNCTTYQDS